MSESKKSGPVRLADVARAAGVSTGTASHALRGDRRIKEATRHKVLEAADRLGYSIDVHASALGSRKGSDRADRELIPIAGVHEIMSGFKEGEKKDALIAQARSMGYEMHFLHMDKKESPARFFLQWWHRGIEGVILNHITSRRDLLDVDWSKFSIVAMGRLPENLPVRRIRPNNFTSAMRLYEICWERGYRRIGCAPMTHDPPLLDDAARLGGLQAADSRRVPWEKRIPPHTGHVDDQRSFTEWLHRWEPDCVIGFMPAVRWWIKDAGLQLPFAACVVPDTAISPVAGMLESGSEMMREALELLDQQIRHRRRGLAERPLETVVESVFRDAPTLTRADEKAVY